MLSVEVRYRQKGESGWQAFAVDPLHYFWSDPDNPARPWEVDSVPKHNDVHELLPLVAPGSLQTVITRVSDSQSEDYFECAYQFWGSRHDYVCMISSQRAQRKERELVFSGNVPFKENGSQVVRVSLNDPIPRVTVNVFMWGPAGDDQTLNMLTSSHAV